MLKQNELIFGTQLDSIPQGMISSCMRKCAGLRHSLKLEASELHQLFLKSSLIFLIIYVYLIGLSLQIRPTSCGDVWA